MKEYEQRNLHMPEEGIIGDCFRTAIGCILDLEPELVPHFTELGGWNSPDSTVCRRLCNEWLEQFNLKYCEYPIECSLTGLGIYLDCYYKDVYVHIGCNSKHGGHSVIMKNDDYIWDPSIDNSGCVGPMSDGYFWIGLLVQHVKE